MKTLVIIPAYNEHRSILNVIERVEAIEPKVDYLVVNDCSRDDTRAILHDNRASFLDLPINLGIGGAVQSGYLYAREHDYDIAIQIDGDGQHDPAYIPVLINELTSTGVDCVVGSRFITNEGFQSSFMRRIGIRFLSSLVKLTCGLKVHDATSGFRAVNKTGIDLFAKYYAQDFPEPESLVTLVCSGCKVTEVPVIMNERNFGSSSINNLKSIYYMTKVSLSIIMARFQFKKVVS
ncbi:MAG: glycosyltransferase family 2 protein [Coriobacteriia bacterium]|nr:glycosyltransferase family 2 protein [Coriobacteriia bacterium]